MIDFNSFLQWSQDIVSTYGYLGLFLVALLSATTVVIPIFPLAILVFLSGSILNPIFVGISAGLGESTGELVGYFVGRAGKKLVKKRKKNLEKVEKLFKKYKGGTAILLLGIVPFIPFDIMGLFCGLINYDVRKFYLLTIIGKTIRYTIVAFAGYYGITWFLESMGMLF